MVEISEQEYRSLLAETGLSAVEAQVADEADWSQYLQSGVLVKLSIHGPIVASQTTLEDLGIRPADEREAEAIKKTQILGYDRIVPERIVKRKNALKNAGTSRLTQYRFRTHWGDYIPAKAYRTWSGLNAELRAQYLALAQEVYETWEDLKREQMLELLVRGRGNYVRLQRAGVALEGTIEEWSSKFAVRKMSRLQSAEVARDSFRWEWTTKLVPIDGAIKATLDAMEASDDPLLRDRARTMRAEQGGGLDQLRDELTGALKTRVYDVACDCLKALKNANGELPSNSVGQLNRLFDLVDQMKFWKDDEFDARVSELRSLVRVDAQARSDADIKKKLIEFGREARLYLLEIDKPPERSAAEYGIPDEIVGLREAVARKGNDLVIAPGPTPILFTRVTRQAPPSLAV